MTARLPLFRRPRVSRARWGAFAERMAHQSVANRRIYLIATSALARARHTAHRRNHPC